MRQHLCPLHGWEECILTGEAHGCGQGQATGYDWRTRRVNELDA